MHTHLTTSPQEAAAFLRAGGLVAFPTETVYGLGADAFNPLAVRKIFVAKGRPADNPLIVHLASPAQIPEVAENVTDSARRLLSEFAPGPLTVILRRRPALPAEVSGGLETVAVRIPGHPVAQEFLEACGRPVAAPSANRSGRPSPTTWQAVLEDLEGRIACILKGNRSEAGLESTVVDCTTDEPVILRTGVITLEAIRSVLPEARLVGTAEDAQARSPGTRYRHYAPDARIQVVSHPGAVAEPESSAYIGLDTPLNPEHFDLVLVCDSVEQYAHELFAFFRQCDAAGIRTIYCQAVKPEGLGLALMDRLRRAATS